LKKWRKSLAFLIVIFSYDCISTATAEYLVAIRSRRSLTTALCPPSGIARLRLLKLT
jgi:hypothetical protein